MSHLQLLKINNLLIALDCGGSKCHAILYDRITQKVLAESTTGASNVASNFERSINHIQQAALQLLSQVNIPAEQLNHIPAYAGLAGVNLPAVAKRLAQWAHPFSQFIFTTDLHIACYAAHNANIGSVIVTGTGSCALALTQNGEYMLGGYGLSLGDQASGAWIGKQAISYSLLSLDGLQKSSKLTDAICHYSKQTTAQTLSQHWYQATPSEYAKLTNLVFNSAVEGDKNALNIVQLAVDYLEQLIDRLSEISNAPICLIGGLSHTLRPWLSNQYQTKLITAQQPPVFGAIKLSNWPQLSLNNQDLRQHSTNH